MDKEIINQVIEIYKSLTDAEFEYRIGRTKDGRFTPYTQNPDKLIKYLLSKKGVWTDYDVEYYDNNIRSKNGKAEIKKREFVHDFAFAEMTVRLAVSTEIPTDVPQTQPIKKRHIRRLSATIDGCIVSLSQTETFETEIEIAKPTTDTTIVEKILQILYDKPNFLTREQIVDITEKYDNKYNLAQTSGFLRKIAKRPINLHRDDDISGCAVSNKLDGTKYTVFIRKYIFAINETGGFVVGECEIETDTVLDAEYDGQFLHVFDGDFKGDYKTRYEACVQLVEQMQIDDLVVKPVLFGDVCKNTKKCIKYMQAEYGKNYRDYNDGIIYTPEGEYGLQPYKWKFPEKITIDLLIKDGIAYAGGRNNTLIPTGVRVNDASAHDGEICEIALDTGAYVVHRVRYDKIQPNYITVVNDTLTDMRNPYTYEELISKCKTYVGGAEITIDKSATVNEIKRDRDTFLPIYDEIYNYIRENQLLRSNPEALIGEYINTICVYTNNSLKTANDISNRIYYYNPTVYMKTVIPYEEFDISILGRMVCKVRQNPKLKNISTDNILGRSFLKPETELITIYHKLYQPYPDYWERSEKIEKELFIRLPENETSEPIEQIGGDFISIEDNLFASKKLYQKEEEEKEKEGGDFIDLETTDFVDVDVIDGGAAHNDNIQAKQIRKAIYELLKYSDFEYVLIGHWAFFATDKHDPHYEKIQFLTRLEPDLVCERVQNAMRDVRKIKLFHKKETLNIPNDMLIEKTTYYCEEKGRKIPIMDTFNSLSYEIVPYVDYEVKVGNPYVLARFLLIDLWILKILHEGNYIIIDVLANKRKQIIEKLTLARGMRGAFTDTYIGVFKDPVIERRKLLRKEEKFVAYKPYDYQKNNGMLREV